LGKNVKNEQPEKKSEIRCAPSLSQDWEREGVRVENYGNTQKGYTNQKT